MLEWLKTILGDAYTEKIETQVAAEIGKAFVSKADFDTKNKELKAAQEQISTLTETVKAADSKDETIKTLQGKVEAYEQAETERRAAEEKAKKAAALKARFEPLRGENKFLNEGTESWIFSEFEKALADKTNEGKSDAEVYAAVTKDKNIYVNPQEPFKMPPAPNNPNIRDGVEAAFLKRNPNLKI